MKASSSVPVQPFARRGFCPALSAPMQTGDGLLSRIAFTEHCSPDDLHALCTLAIRHGNGLLDITARGGLQFRGLTLESAANLERDVLALGLPLRQGLAVETSPLAGMDDTAICDPREIVSRISEAAAALALHDKLAAKMSVIIDGGGHVALADLLADIRLKAARVGEASMWQLMLGGNEDKALRAGFVATEDAATVVIDLLSHLADLGPNARGRDLALLQVRAICGDRLVAGPGMETQVGTAASPYGLRHLSNNRFAAVLAPAFGQTPAARLSFLCAFASSLGMTSVRPGPAHALFFIGDEAACDALLGYARENEFITIASDPRSSIAACAGQPGCASAHIATRELASHAAAECGDLLDGSLTLHLSGCGKGCAHPGAASLAFSGHEEGLAFFHSGSVSGVADAILPRNDQRAALSRLARLYEKEHKPGENARALLARLGKQRIVAALRQDDR
ncbi:precorrin-3B synthase [Agrobacterium sp. fls2-241-TYG-188a]|uniref:precorrin-3B synthase n=1 Tax=Agrobacterium sp. fls2-241-TYG-188a TaxID=3040275 RepID=UPI00254F6FA3|nr:precorrin-3B synthase [Agrobacterium sp. fls2-241-TYG-188a]